MKNTDFVTQRARILSPNAHVSKTNAPAALGRLQQNNIFTNKTHLVSKSAPLNKHCYNKYKEFIQKSTKLEGQ